MLRCERAEDTLGHTCGNLRTGGASSACGGRAGFSGPAGRPGSALTSCVRGSRALKSHRVSQVNVPSQHKNLGLLSPRHEQHQPSGGLERRPGCRGAPSAGAGGPGQWHLPGGTESAPWWQEGPAWGHTGLSPARRPPTHPTGARLVLEQQAARCLKRLRLLLPPSGAPRCQRHESPSRVGSFVRPVARDAPSSPGEPRLPSSDRRHRGRRGHGGVYWTIPDTAQTGSVGETPARREPPGHAGRRRPQAPRWDCHGAAAAFSRWGSRS